jgi:hypothetical protein
MLQTRKYESNAQRQAAYRQRMQQARNEQLSARSLPPLPAIPAMPGKARWREALRQAHWLIEMTVSEMQAYSDERSDEWQEGDKGELFTNRIESLQDLLDALDELIV